MTWKVTEAAQRVLLAFDDGGGSGVLAHQGSICRILVAGELLKCMSDTILRLLCWDYLRTDGDGRLDITNAGREQAGRFRARGGEAA